MAEIIVNKFTTTTVTDSSGYTVRLFADGVLIKEQEFGYSVPVAEGEKILKLDAENFGQWDRNFDNKYVLASQATPPPPPPVEETPAPPEPTPEPEPEPTPPPAPASAPINSPSGDQKNESLIERSILTIIEPTIVLDKLEIPDAESGTENSEGITSKIPPSKTSSIIPLIRINTFDIQGGSLQSFRLRNTGFYPTVKFVFTDNTGLFMARYFPKDGDIIQVYIRSQGTEDTFKPIRIDFTIVDVSPVGGGGGQSANEISIEGRIFVPNLFTEKVQSYQSTSWNALLSIAEELSIGFASNVDDTADDMNWINPNDTPEKFIEDIVANSYLDDDSFFTAYIDPYYYLNLVNVNSLFSQNQDIEPSLNFLQNSGDLLSDSTGQDEVPNFLTNKVEAQGSSRYISKFQQVNETGSITKVNGYRRYTQYWDLQDREFVSEFVDPIVDNTSGMIPLTKGRIIEGEVEGPRNDQVKYKYLGVRSDNVHDEYMYAAIHNYQNLSEIKKVGMIVELDTANPALLRYSRIPCLIFEYSPTVKNVLTNPAGDGDLPANVAQRTTTPEEDDRTPILNEALSGFYVISGYEYILTDASILRMKLYLQRREGTPTT
jgi:hypothetical protein